MSFALRVVARKAAAVPTMSVRSIATSAVRKDLVQDLYLNQLKNYKAPAKAQNAHEGVVKSYSPPTPPTPPTLPSDLTSELASFDSTEPVLAGASASESTAGKKDVGEQGGAGFETASGFLEHVKADLPKADAHH